MDYDLARRWLMRWPFTWPNEFPNIDGSSPAETSGSTDAPDPSETQGAGTAPGLAIDPMFPLSPLMGSSVAQVPPPQRNVPAGVLDDAASGSEAADQRTTTTPRPNLVPDWIAPAIPTPRSQTGRSLDPNLGVPVTLPNGDRLPDPLSPTGHVMSPVDNLAAVAAAGREIGQRYQSLLRDGTTPPLGETAYLVTQLDRHLGHGGIFDYQREGNRLAGFTQLRQWRNISNVNVGLLCQQAGLSLDQTLAIAGGYAGIFSSNADPNRATGLEERTERYIRTGYEIGRSGAFGALPPR